MQQKITKEEKIHFLTFLQIYFELLGSYLMEWLYFESHDLSRELRSLARWLSRSLPLSLSRRDFFLSRSAKIKKIEKK